MTIEVANKLLPADSDSQESESLESAVDLLRFITAGSVDDGKSTLIGRLLFDSKSLFGDQVSSITTHGSGDINFANLTDGLKAEREQGITIDVAYRYFSTAKRRFIVADTPGHVQYTRNMITAASTTNLSLILVDAGSGITEQTMRHAYLSYLLGIPRIIVCINKMDLVGYSPTVFNAIRSQFLTLARELKFRSVDFIPISALHGDNVVQPSSNFSWYNGLPLLQSLEEIEIDREPHAAARFPVQWIIKAGNQVNEKENFRGYAGQIFSGTFSVGDQIVVQPSGKTSHIKEINTFDGALTTASAPLSVTLLLEDAIDVGRGDVLTHVGQEARVNSELTAIVCWLDEQPLQKNRIYTIKNGTRISRVKATEFLSKIDINALSSEVVTKSLFESLDPLKSLHLNEIGTVSFIATSQIVFDSYEENRLTGSFIIIDEVTNATAGAGLFLNSATERTW